MIMGTNWIAFKSGILSRYIHPRTPKKHVVPLRGADRAEQICPFCGVFISSFCHLLIPCARLKVGYRLFFKIIESSLR